MGKKSTPTPPPAPNPIQVAGAQQDMNDASARLNAEINRFDEFNPYGSSTWHKDPSSDQWTRINQLDPADQRMLDMQRGIGEQGLQAAGSQFGKVADMMSTPLTSAGLPPRVSTLPAPNLQTNIAGAGSIRRDIGDAGPIQRGLDFGGVEALNRDFSGERNRVEKALYDRNTQFMDERYNQDREGMLSDLRARGITEGSEAWNREADRAERNREAAYDSARNAAILAGGQEQSRLFGQDLAARQQGVGELAQQGGFANQAQQQAMQQAMQGAAFGNTAQQQQFGQNAAQMEALNNALQGQFGLQSNAANFQNAQRAGQLAEQAYFRNQPMNELSALMNMSPIQGPNAQNIAQVASMPADYQGQVNANFAQQSQNYQNQLANQSSIWDSVFGLGRAFI